MLSAKLIEFIESPIQQGIHGDRAWELFDLYVALYVDGNLEAIEDELDWHRTRFTKFVKRNLENEGSVKKLTPLKSNTSDKQHPIPHRFGVDVSNGAIRESFFEASSGVSESESVTEEHLQLMRENAMAAASVEEASMDDVTFALWKIFGIRSFRSNQEEIVLSILAGHDTFVLMPTGGGKSLCYQLPAVLSPGLTIVVSPLLSLVQDQVRTLVTLPSGGVPTSYLNSSQTTMERRAVYREIKKDELTCKLLYVTPEQLTCNQSLIEILQQQQRLKKFARMVIDEAHCVSMWGHDFRPAYADLGRVKTELFPGLQTVALTATANLKVKRDILQSLGMASNVQEFQMSFYRSNLKFIVVKKESFHQGMAMLEKYIRGRNRHDCGIVYCLSRQECEEVAQSLNSLKIRSLHYHAGMTSAERESVQNDWMSGVVRVVVATIAFGMGIDNPHVRYVVHFVLPKSLENYYQEAGRAGRDGQRSECILFYSGKDVGRLKLLIRRNNPDYKKGYELIEHVRDYCLDETACRHGLLLEYLDEKMTPASCRSNCHICCSQHEGRSVTEQCPWSIVTAQEIDTAKTRASKVG